MRIPMFIKRDQNSSVLKDKIIIPMFIKIGPVFLCLEGQNHNSNIYKNRARIPMFRTIRSETQCV